MYKAFWRFVDSVFGLKKDEVVVEEQVQPSNPYQDYRICNNGKRSKSTHLTVTDQQSAFYGKTLCGYGNIQNMSLESVKEEDLTNSTICKKCLKMLAKIQGAK